MKERKTFWDKNAGRYDRFMRKDRAAYEEMYKLIRPVVKAKTVLELATGTGLIAKHIVNAAAHIEATDASAEMIAEAKRDNHSAKLHFSVQDMFRLPYADKSFDVVIVSNALHIVPQPEKALARVRRGEVDRQARHRPVERAGFRGGAHALSGLADRAGRQSYHIEPRQSARKQTLNRDDISVYAVDTGGKYARDHARSILSEGSCASSVEQKPLYRINIPYHSPFHNTKTVGLHRKNGWKNGNCFTMQNGLSKNEKTSEKNGFCCLQSFASVIQ